MVEQNVISPPNPLSKRIFDIIQDVADFVILLLQIALEVFKAFVELFTPKSQKDVSGEVVLITGAGHGMGRELALQYTALFSTVICVDINEKNNEETLNRAKKLNKGMVHSFTCDVSNREAVLHLADQIKRDVGLVSVLVNNAGIMPTKRLENQTEAEIRQTYEVNVFAHFWILEAFLPHMKEQNRGHIIAMSSMTGLVAMPDLVPYSGSKFAVRGLMEGLYHEIRTGPFKDLIKLTVIYPYAVDTGLCDSVKSRFPSLLAMLDPKHVAEKLIEAHRSDAVNVSVPSYMQYINNWARLLPHRCSMLIYDYMNCAIIGKK